MSDNGKLIVPGSKGKKRVLISVPNMGWINKFVVHDLIHMLSDTRQHSIAIFPTHIPYENNLNHIVKEFVSGEQDFWLNIDADNPPACNPLDLVELDLDIVGLPTPVWQWYGRPKERPVYWSGYDWKEGGGGFTEHEQKKGLQKVDAIGTGCFLVAQRVFHAPLLRKGAFLRIWNEDGTVKKGNDIAFCERATKAGFEIYCHYDYPCMHFKELELSEVTRAFQGLYEPVEAEE